MISLILTPEQQALPDGGKGEIMAEIVDTPAASGAILADVRAGAKMPVADGPGEEFLDYVKGGMSVTVGEDGLVTVQ